MSLWIKICGVTTPEDAQMVQEAGADAVGLNFAQKSPRFLEAERAKGVAEVLRDKVEIVGVFVDASIDEIRSLAERVGFDTAQLHGSESPEFLEELNQYVPAFKALRIGSAEDVEVASSYGGDRILTDAKVAGAMGGTGETFDWSLIEGLNERTKLILAGGLNPDNVEECVRVVQPYGIDTASGVEESPGKKSAEKVKAFVEAARRGYYASS